jgi:hypothetical protein
MFHELMLYSRMQMRGQSFVSNEKWDSPPISSIISELILNGKQAREPNPSRQKKKMK